MSGLIKASDRVRGLAVQPVLRPVGSASAKAERSAFIPQADPLLAENEKLRALLEERDATIAAHESALRAAHADGEAAGRIAAEAEFEEDRAASLELLEQGLEDARAEFVGALANAEGLAVLVAREVLEKMFGDCEARQQMVVDGIKHQFARVERGAVVGMEVSREDFPDTAQVAQLANDLGLPSGAVHVSDSVAGGDCRVKMRLGGLDIGLNRQWGAIREALMQMSDSEEEVE